MFKWIRSWPHWLRASSLSLVCFVLWAFFSIPPLLDNQPEAFQAAGSIVVAWGIFNLTRQRLQHEAQIKTAEEAVVATLFNRLEARNKISDFRTELTFDVHMSQISRISRHIGLPNLIGPNTNEEIEALIKSIAERTGGKEFMPVPKEEMAAQEAISKLKATNRDTKPWIKTLWWLELGLIIFGTIQWGYGNHWVVFFHEVILS